MMEMISTCFWISTHDKHDRGEMEMTYKHSLTWRSNPVLKWYWVVFLKWYWEVVLGGISSLWKRYTLSNIGNGSYG